MEDSKFRARKVFRKQRRVLAAIEKDTGIKPSENPTTCIAILNIGLSNGLTAEILVELASSYGTVAKMVMLPHKSFCFLKTTKIIDAEAIYNGMHNKATIGQNGAVVYLSYMSDIPEMDASQDELWQSALPEGLVVLPNFVTSDEEQMLLQATKGCAETIKEGLKHRAVRHYGYEFLYNINNVDTTRRLKAGIPETCDILWSRLAEVAKSHGLPQFDWYVPDQLTVNEYKPGDGIPPHVDTHSAFSDPIISLSLESDIVMIFKSEKKRIAVNLPQRSLLIMSGESRYDWIHGIIPKFGDIVPTDSGALTLRMRNKRTSLTFRHLRRAPCQCAFPRLCDTRLNAKNYSAKQDQLEDVAEKLEQLNVHAVYDKIADHFSETRHTPWPLVADFVNTFEPASILLDVGCGNGKYLNSNPNVHFIGCDRSKGLLDVCRTRGSCVFRCDCLQIPIRDASVDGCISIAVIHHLATAERRKGALAEISRVLRTGGRALIYVWAKKQNRDAQKSSYLRQNKAVNKQKTTEDEQRKSTIQKLEQNDAVVSLPVHTNRTEFQHQDVLVPWKSKDEEKTTFLRYYHVFEENELENLIVSLPELELLRSYYDQGNHCVIFSKK